MRLLALFSSRCFFFILIVILDCVSQCPGAGFTLFPSTLLDGDENNMVAVSDIHEKVVKVPEHYVHGKIYSAFNEYNRELLYYSHESALIAWNMSNNMTPEILDKNQKFTIEKNIWNNHWCGELLKVYSDPEFGHFQYRWDTEHLRQLYLICRGPRFSSYQLSHIVSVLGSLQQLYNKKVCISSIGKCLRMEPDLNHLMEWTRDEAQLREAWISWHKTIGTEVKPLYAGLIRMLNQGAKQAGFTDMGQCWRNEMEMGDVREEVVRLYSEVEHLYKLLHAFVRHKLEKFYNLRFHNGLIPSHLLGNMWAQKWDSLMDVMMTEAPKDENNKVAVNSIGNQSRSLVNKLLPLNNNVTVLDMVKAAENFYVSMGLPHLPESFWENSYFQDKSVENVDADKKGYPGMRKANSRNCHGSAANMYDTRGNGDYRMMMCAQVSDEDLITIHHEVGHIMYFMAYSKQPTIFQDGANTAFHEAVGDSITYDLIHYKQSQDKDYIQGLLRTGLAKLPQIGFGLIMDMWRWDIFEQADKVTKWNDLWWQLNEKYLGITKPAPDYNDKGEGLDAAGKFHIIDNIPYIRYFFASFLQLQFYESMCAATGTEFNGNLQNCRIRGSTQAGQILWNMMKQGTSRRWQEILMEMTGTDRIESRALLNYFDPLKIWLEREIERLNITSVGW